MMGGALTTLRGLILQSRIQMPSVIRRDVGKICRWKIIYK